MRTLKKTLSLVLVVAMVLGLCVVGASATNKVDGYEDAGKIGAAYTEAVGVMTGLGIVDGVTDTELRPENTYQRDQAAKIIAYMLLGKNKADSLSCTVAPFEDVPANHWAAGYIAFCKEQGIIDGVTETTFNPTGTLTGFQWAKMLLCAVGFGVNGEFEGDSWSLNTSKVAHTVDLFAGDLAGADHVALQRQQAMLYAFNALTNVDVVVYSAALGDYIEWYSGFVGGRFTYTGTLGENVYSLYSTTGIVVDNEAMGNSTTDIASSYTGADIANIKASTGLDMMYHAAKVWFTGTAATTTKAASGTAVYVKDLAKTTEYCCGDIATGKAAAAKLTTPPKGNFNIGNVPVQGAKPVEYEYDIVDNSAVSAGTVTVTTHAYLAALGYASTAGKTTYIGTENVKNEYIKTDISAITSTATPNVVIKAGEKAYHVFAPTATTGAVTKVTETANGFHTITLSDGTVLKESTLSYDDKRTEIGNLIDILAEKDHVKPNYYFLLDTHGDYFYLSQEPFRTVAYFTGAKAYTGGTNDWWPDATYKAQFVDIETGEIEEIPVTATWVKTAKDTKGYYDITDELYGDATYAPDLVLPSDTNYYGLKYAYAGEETFNVNTTGTKRVMTVGGDHVYYDDTVVFYIANYNGSKLVVDKYVGVTGLVEGYAAKHNTTVSAVTLKNAAITYTKSVAGNKVAVTVFAYDTAVARGGYIFFPKDVNGWSGVSDNYMAVTGYKNGTAETETAKFTKTYFEGTLNGALRRGFYTYTVNEAGYYKVTRLENDNQRFVYDKTTLGVTEINGATYFNGVAVASDCKVVDTRTLAPTVDKIESVDQIINCNNWSGDNPYGPFAIAYVVQNKQISTIYVVEFNLGEAKITIGNTVAGWKFSDGTTTGSRFEDGTVRLYNDGLAALDEGTVVTFEGTYALDGSATYKNFVATGKVVKPTSGDPYVAVTVDDLTEGERGYDTADITIDEAYYVVKVDNKQTEFSVNYKCGDMASSAAYPTTGIEMPVGGQLDLAFLRDTVVANIASKVAYVNNTTAATAEVNSIAKQIWIKFTPKGNTVTINSITAELTLSLGDKSKDPAVLFNFNYDGAVATSDTLKVPFVPGSTITFSVKRSGTPISGVDGKQLKFATGCGNIISVETVEGTSEETAVQVFTFKTYLPKHNSDSVTGMSWVKEEQA